MQICFILDNGPSTLQRYNTSFAQSGTNTNLSILEIFKYHIETSLNTLFRDGVLMREYTGLHLFCTSNPGVPLASFQHDFGHFMFQLKDLGNGFLGKNGENGLGGVGGRGRAKIGATYPAQTIKLALQHVAKFRVLTESQSVMGYRQATIVEPTVIIFLSYGMTLRKIQKMQSLNLHKYMRSEFKFIHYRLALPQLHIQAGDKDKEITLKEFKEELENSLEYRRLLEISERMNRGECKNIVKNTGAGCLSDCLTKMFTSYVPSFYCELGYGFDLNNQFPEYFKPSEINEQNLGINSQMAEQKEKSVEKHKEQGKEMEKIKVDLIFRCDDNGSQIQSSVPIPLDINLKQEKHGYGNGEIWEIAEVFPLSFYVDFGKKLVRSISNSVPFDKYLISAANTPKLSKLEKQLQILGISEIFFPVYTNVPLMAGASKRQLLLTGLLHYSSISSASGHGVNQSGFGYSFELIVSYGSFPFIEWISNSLEMGDMRKIEKMMMEYHSILPDFYVRYLREYFKYLRVDLAMKYDNVIVASLQNNINVMKNNHIKQREQVQYSLRSNMQEIKNHLEKLKIQNMVAHSKNVADCCVIYSPVQNYKNFTRYVGGGAGSVGGIDGVMKKLLEAVGQINNHYGFDGYFGGITAVRQMPVTRELERYGGISRMINDEIEGEGDGSRDNRSQAKNEGAFGKKKVKKSENMGNPINFYGIEEPDSVMPEENQSDPFGTTNNVNQVAGQSQQQISANQDAPSHQQHLKQESAQKSLLQPSFFQQKQALPQTPVIPPQVSNLPPVNSSMLDSNHEQSIVEGLPMRRSSSVDYNSEKGQVDSVAVDDVKIDVIEYVNSLPVQSPVKVNFNAGGLIKDKRYREILGRLAGVGLVKDLGKFVVS